MQMTGLQIERGRYGGFSVGYPVRAASVLTGHRYQPEQFVQLCVQHQRISRRFEKGINNVITHAGRVATA
jgi:hypothetical protein